MLKAWEEKGGIYLGENGNSRALVVPLLREKEVELLVGRDSRECFNALHYCSPSQRFVQLEGVVLWQLVCVHQMERLCLNLQVDALFKSVCVHSGDDNTTATCAHGNEALL